MARRVPPLPDTTLHRLAKGTDTAPHGFMFVGGSGYTWDSVTLGPRGGLRVERSARYDIGPRGGRRDGHKAHRWVKNRRAFPVQPRGAR